jgi:hypothetical protein
VSYPTSTRVCRAELSRHRYCMFIARAVVAAGEGMTAEYLRLDDSVGTGQYIHAMVKHTQIIICNEAGD